MSITPLRQYDIGSYRFHVTGESCTGFLIISLHGISNPNNRINSLVESYDHMLHGLLTTIIPKRLLTNDELKQLLHNQNSTIKPILEQEPFLSKHFSKKELGKLPLLWIAVLGCYQKSAELLVLSGAYVNELFGSHEPQIIDEKWSILHVLLQMNPSTENELLIALVMDHGADLRARDSCGNTVLHFTVRKDRVQLSKMFLEKGVDVNVAGDNGQTPLLIAAKGKKANELVPLLMIHGADVTVKTLNGENALHLLAHHSDADDAESVADIARVFIEQGVSLNARESNAQFQPIHYAVSYGRHELVKLFLDHGANVNSLVYNDKFPLYLAAERKNPALLETLLKRGANIHLETINGRTALHKACRYSLMENILVLVSAGAYLLIEDKNGMTPFALISPKNMENPSTRLMIKLLALRKANKRLPQPSFEWKDERMMKQQHPKLWDYYRDCHAHISIMKITRFIKNCTFYELLTESHCHIAALMRNPDFQVNFELYDLNGFSMYAEDILRAFQRAQNHYRSMLEQENLINVAVYNTLPYVVVRKVVSYIFLCCKNLK